MSRNGRAESQLGKQWRRLEQRNRDKVVLIDVESGKTYTWRGLTEAADRFSTLLADSRPGERIAFRLPNGAEWMALFLALQRAGLAAMPLDQALPTVACLETARRLRAHAVYVDGKFHVLDRGGRRKPSVSCIKVTSGSAGEPKAIECGAEHLLADGRQVIATMRIRSGDLNLATIPLGHSYGLGNLVMPLILQGTAMVCAPSYVPRQLIEWIQRHQVTVFPSVPAVFRVLAALPAGARISSLRLAISAGAPLSPEIAEAFQARFGIRIHNFYGSSETGGICYDRTGTASLTGRSVGRPLSGVTLSLEQGRIVVASPAVATRSGLWRLGDFGEWNARGEVVLLGRGGVMANIGGRKVHPREVERVLRSLPGVTDAAVWLGRAESRDLLTAAVETIRTRAEIERELATCLPAWKWPKAYLLAPELSRTARGKLDLTALRASLQFDARPSTSRPRATST